MKTILAALLLAFSMTVYAGGEPTTQARLTPVPQRVAMMTAKNALKVCTERLESIGVSSNRSFMEHRFSGCKADFQTLRVIRVYGADAYARDDEWFLLVNDDTAIEIEDN